MMLILETYAFSREVLHPTKGGNISTTELIHPITHMSMSYHINNQMNLVRSNTYEKSYMTDKS